MELKKVLLTLLLTSCVSSQSVVDNDASENNTQNHPVRDYANITRVENLLNIFNIEYVGRNWMTVNEKISKKCAHNMMQYLDGLQDKKTWAMKSK